MISTHFSFLILQQLNANATAQLYDFEISVLFSRVFCYFLIFEWRFVEPFISESISTRPSPPSCLIIFFYCLNKAQYSVEGTKIFYTSWPRIFKNAVLFYSYNLETTSMLLHYTLNGNITNIVK